MDPEIEATMKAKGHKYPLAGYNLQTFIGRAASSIKMQPLWMCNIKHVVQTAENTREILVSNMYIATEIILYECCSHSHRIT